MAPRSEAGARPLLSVDIDGVLARPPFGLTATMNRDVSLSPDPRPISEDEPSGPDWFDRIMAASYYRVRYGGRSPMPGAVDTLAAARDAGYRMIALTGRDWRGRASTERWLARQGMLAFFEAVHMNSSGRCGRRFPSARFKEAVCEQLGVQRHIDDDPATAALLSRNGVTVDLIEWPRSRGLALPDSVTRRRDMGALATELRAQPSGTE